MSSVTLYAPSATGSVTGADGNIYQIVNGKVQVPSCNLDALVAAGYVLVPFSESENFIEDEYLEKNRLLANTCVIFGDSITALNLSVASTQVQFLDYGWFNWLQLLSENTFSLLNNAGVSGNTTQMMNARIETDVISYKPKYTFVLGGINNIGTNNDSVSTIIADLQLIYTKLKNEKIHVFCLTILPLYTGHANVNATNTGKIQDVNKWIREWCQLNDGFTLIDTYAAVIDPGSATGVALSGYLRTDNIHPSAKGARAMGAAAYAVTNKFIQKTAHHVMAYTDSYAYNSASKQQAPNPTMTGSGGSTVNGAGGTLTATTVAASWTAGFSAGTAGDACTLTTAQRTVAADGDTIGSNQVCTISSAGATTNVKVRNTGLAAQFSPSDRVYAEAYFSVKNMVNVKGVHLYLFITSNGTSYTVNGMSPVATIYDQTDFTGPIITPEFTIPAGGAVTSAQIIAEITFSGAGSAVFAVGRMGFFKK